jgi:hypothetical protein
MSLPLELPPPINQELTQDSQREGISEMEHAALLLCLASAFKHEEPVTPFQNAVREFLSHRSLDAEQVFSVFEELVHVCLAVNEAGRNDKTADKEQTEEIYLFLKQWRSATVHEPSNISYVVNNSDVLPLKSEVPHPNSVNRGVDQAAEPNCSDRVSELLVQWQAEDKTPLRTSPTPLQGETAAQALFRKWKDEDALMTDEEKAAEDRLWQDIEQGILNNRMDLSRRRQA